jgi:hypothetical protein
LGDRALVLGFRAQEPLSLFALFVFGRCEFGFARSGDFRDPGWSSTASWRRVSKDWHRRKGKKKQGEGHNP